MISKKQFYCGNGRVLGLNLYMFISATDMITIWAVTINGTGRAGICAGITCAIATNGKRVACNINVHDNPVMIL